MSEAVPSGPATLNDDEVRRRLATAKASPDFRNTPLRAALELLGDVAGVPIHISPAVFEEVPEDALRVTLRAYESTVATTLQRVLESARLAMLIRDGTVLVIRND